MKGLLALLLLIVLVGLGWNQSYKEHYRYVSSVISGKPFKRNIKATPVPQRDTSWMWR